MEDEKKYVDYYHNRFSRLLSENKDSLFVQELNAFLCRDEGFNRQIKFDVIEAVRTIKGRSLIELETLIRRSPEYVDRYSSN